MRFVTRSSWGGKRVAAEEEEDGPGGDADTHNGLHWTKTLPPPPLPPPRPSVWQQRLAGLLFVGIPPSPSTVSPRTPSIPSTGWRTVVANRSDVALGERRGAGGFATGVRRREGVLSRVSCCARLADARHNASSARGHLERGAGCDQGAWIQHHI